MAIAYKSQGAGAGTETNNASLDLVAPATVDANDILIAQVIHTGTTTAPSTPSGWSLLYGPANIGTTATGRHWCFGKLAVGNEDGATIGFGTAGGTNGRAGRIYSFSGYVSGTLADVVPAASFSDIAHATDPQGPAVTTTKAGALAVALTCQDDNNTEEAIASATGGTWGGFVTYVDANWGPQGIHIDIQVATPTADPGTISGGATVAANDEASTIGFEIRDSVPVTNVTVTPTGVGGTGAVGNETITASALVIETGVVGTSGVGTVTTTAGALVVETGLAGTSAVGTVTVETTSPDVTVSATGVSGTGSVGEETITASALLSLMGLNSASAVGTVSVQGFCLVLITGVFATGNEGDEYISTESEVGGEYVGSYYLRGGTGYPCFRGGRGRR
ncbi:hypothetical protein HYS85_00230 [Candidatus Saccharibacteria bacterium]|nr:hypothetical protein [Candidatus Saccharibacteria bacterium]